MKKRFIFTLLFFLLWVCVGQAFAQENWDQKFDKQITNWIDELSQKDQLFLKWSEATYKTEALGPNSKEWLVTLFIKEEPIGYMVIAESDQKNLILLEYGTEEIPLFEKDLINYYFPELIGQIKELTLVYQGLSSHFLIKDNKNEQMMIDAKTGELIPKEFTINTKENKTSKIKGSTPSDLLSTFTKPLSNIEENFPFEVFLKKTSPLKDWEQVKEKRVYLKTTIWNDKIHLLLPIVGLHEWSNQITYIAVEQDGYRFLPVSTKKEKGGDIPPVFIEDLIYIDDHSSIVHKNHSNLQY